MDMTRRELLASAASVGALSACAGSRFWLPRNDSVREIPTAKSYVRDGLIAMWDGMENSGWWMHNPYATTWKDLANNHDMTAFNNTVGGVYKWEKDSANYNGVDPQAFVCSTLDYSSIKTIEVVHMIKEADTFYVPMSFAQLGQSNGGFAFQFLRNGIQGSHLIRYNYLYNTIYSTSTSPGGITFVNGTIISHETPTFRILDGSYTRSLFVGCGQQYSDYPGYYAYGAFYSIRLYSRTLSELEMQKNYAVDRIRFNIS